MTKKNLCSRIFPVILLVSFMLVSAGSQAQQRSPINWQFSVDPINKKEAMLVFKATLDEGWHVYSQHMEDGGPLPTSFKFVPSEDYKLLGDVQEDGTPVESYDETFMMDIVWFSHSVEFKQKIKLNSNTATIKGNVEFMACNEEMCLPPERKPFTLTVEGKKKGV